MSIFKLVRKGMNVYPFLRGRHFIYRNLIKIKSFEKILFKVENPFKTRLGYFISLNKNDYTSNWIKLFGEHNEPLTYDFLSNHLSEGDHFIDIGSNVGIYSLFVAHKFKGAVKVIAFEPNPNIFKHLSESIKINGFENIMNAYQLGLSDTDDYLSFDEDKIDSGSSHFTQNSSNSNIKLPVIKFDDWYSKNKILINKIGCLKIDVEGFEVKVLLGMKETITKFYPPILVECVEENLISAGYNSTELKNLISEYGYIIQQEVENNLYCIHKDKIKKN